MVGHSFKQSLETGFKFLPRMDADLGIKFKR
jgi:hypothetical protein